MINLLMPLRDELYILFFPSEILWKKIHESKSNVLLSLKAVPK